MKSNVRIFAESSGYEKENDKSLVEWFDEQAEEFIDAPEVKAYGAMLSFSGDICIRRDELGMKQIDIVKKLKKSRAWISKFFSDPSNMSVKKLFEMADAVEADVEIQLVPRAIEAAKPKATIYLLNQTKSNSTITDSQNSNDSLAA